MNIHDVENLAELARIEISEAEKEALLKDMGGILDYVKQIETVELPARNAAHNAAGGGDVDMDFPLYNAWREDAETERDFDTDSIKAQFPDKQGDFLKVKKIL